MANTVPVLQIPVDDSQFQAFLETFQKFKLEAADVPNAMADIERAIDRLPEHLRPGTEALEEAAEGAADALEDADVAGGGSGGGSGGGGGRKGGGKRRGSSSRKREAAVALDWVLAGTGAKRFASTISGATRDLARWEKLTGVFAGLLGAGGLYGLDVLAAGASRRRQESAGYGLSTGELASFQTNYGRLGDTSGVLAGLSGAETDFAKRQPLQSLGVDPRGKNSLAIFGEILPKLKSIADHTDPRTFGPAIQARGLDKIGIGVEMMRLIRSLPDEEVASLSANARRDANVLGIPDDVAVKWQELNTALHKAGARFQTVIADELVQLTPGLTHLSETATGLFDKLLARKELATFLKRTNDGLVQFAGDVGSKASQDKIKEFLHHFDMAKSDFDTLNRWVSDHGATLGAVFGAAVGARFGPVGALAGALGGAMVGGSATHGRTMRRQYEGGAAAERPTLEQRNIERRAFGLPTYKDKTEYDKAEPAPQPRVNETTNPASPTPAGSGSVDKDLSGDLSSRATYARRGEEVADPQAFIVHHTGGRGDAQGVVNTLNGRGLGVQYVLDRDGHVFRTLPEGHRGAHILPGNVDGRQLSNANTLGMEVIAKDDSDVTPAQVEAARKFYADLHKKYPHIEAFGHGYVNPGHKMASEGRTITDAIRADERTAAQGPARDATKAAQEAASGVPMAQRGFMRGYAGRDDVPHEMRNRADHRRLVRGYLSGHPDARPKPPQTVLVTDNSGGSSTVVVAH